VSEGRAVPTSLAGIVSELELNSATIVTLSYLEGAQERIGFRYPATELAERLRRLGWLKPLRVRGAWQFAPARLGGAVVEDRFIELRALMMTRPEIRISVGYESAAFIRGFIDRPPEREVLVFEHGTGVVAALDRFRRTLLTLPEAAYSMRRGLRVKTANGLFASICMHPEGFRAWDELVPNLAHLIRAIDINTVSVLLDGSSASAWARAAYLCARGGDPSAGAMLLRGAPPASGPFYLGAGRKGGYYDKTTRVIDTLVLPSVRQERRRPGRPRTDAT
jgi:hypothetical protein